MSQPKTRKGRKSKYSRTPTYSQEVARPLRTMNGLMSRELIYHRRMAGAEFTISTTAGGVVSLAQILNSANVTTCPDWSSASGMFQLYRVRTMVVKVEPFYPVTTWNGVSITTVPAALYVAPFYAGALLTSLQGHLDSPAVKMCSGYRPMTYSIDFKGDIESHFWTAVGVAQPAVEQFGATVIGQNATSTANTPVWRGVVWYEVELKMAS